MFELDVVGAGWTMLHCGGGPESPKSCNSPSGFLLKVFAFREIRFATVFLRTDLKNGFAMDFHGSKADYHGFYQWELQQQHNSLSACERSSPNPYPCKSAVQSVKIRGKAVLGICENPWQSSFCDTRKSMAKLQ